MMKVVKNKKSEVEKDLVAEVDGKMVTAEELLSNLETNKNKPTPEEVEQAEKEYTELAAEFNSKEYEIGTVNEANDIYKFFLDYIENHVMWTKNGWMGVIRLNDEVSKKFEEFQKNAVSPFKLGYQALEFTMFMLSNPGGIGLNSAKAIEILSDLYIFVMEEASAKLDAARVELKNIQFLYDKWIAMQQGFYLEREDSVEIPVEEGSGIDVDKSE